MMAASSRQAPVPRTIAHRRLTGWLANVKLKRRARADHMTRRAKAEHASGFTVLLVDDNADYLQATRLLLEREGHNVLTATNGAEALSILPQQTVDLLLLDYFMPGMTGEQVVAELRKFDPFVQVILQTGYASEQPPRELLQRLSIQGYYDKTEGPEQLLLWTTVGLKAAATTQLLFRSRRAMSFIAESTPKLQRSAAAGEPIHEMLAQVAGLSAALFDGPPPETMIATLDARAELHVRAGTGRFAAPGPVRAVCDASVAGALAAALQGGEPPTIPCTVLPLRAGPLTLGAIYLDRSIHEDHIRDAFTILAQQAAVAIHSARLAELAAVDLLTGAQVRSVFERSLLRELRATFRAGTGLALALFEVDGLGAINARGGRTAGDLALQAVASALAKVSRAEDIVGRYGGDTFGVILRNAAPEGAARLGERLTTELRARASASPSHEVPSVHTGFAAAPAHGFAAGDVAKSMPSSYFASLAELMKATAVAALGEAQREGAGAIRGGALVNWPRL